MIDLLSTAQVLLHDAGFTLRLTSIERTSLLCFEDDSLMGFCSTFTSVESLLGEWRSRETSILSRYAASFRSAGDKAWNVYCVFLTDSVANSVQARQVHWIEEDLERTRKIAASGVAVREDLVRTLLPILPLQYQPVLRAEDVTERLQKRISSIAPKAAQAALDERVSPSEVVRLLGELP